MKKKIWLVSLALLLWEASAWGQVRKEANYLRIDGTPTVLLWAGELRDIENLEQYAAIGFNTVYLPITNTAEESLSQISTLAQEAESRGLLVVVALTPSRLWGPDGNALAINADSQSYITAVNKFVETVVQALGNQPRLIAWSVEAVPPEQVAWGDLGFRAYLRSLYGSLGALNEAWGAGFEEWDQIVASGVRDIDSGRPGGLGRASVDYAYYRQTAYTDALSLWAQTLRAADPNRLVFISSLTDYRSIISVPDTYSGLILNTYPTVAEPDWQTHNVHAVDIARRANQFAAIPTLWVTSTLNPNQLRNWMEAALLHGAAGIAFSDWQVINSSPSLQQVVKQTIQYLSNTRAFPAQPAPHAAILYEPLAGGAMVNGRGLYGYLNGVTPNEPTQLFAGVRRGSRFGQFDVLGLESLDHVNPERYSTIIAPMALHLPEELQVKLNNFVLRGGALLVDAGVGMYEAGGDVTSTPPVLTELFGLHYATIEERPPSWEGSPGTPGETSPPGIAFPISPEQAGLTLDPSVRKFADILEQLLSRPDVRKFLGEEFMEGNLRVRGLGSGFAVYAPAFLYQNWRPTDPFYNEFHDRILSWNSDLEIIEPREVWPSTPVARYASGSIAAASLNGDAVVVDIHDGENQVYQVPDGVERLPNPQEDDRVELLFPGASLAIANPLPIFLRPAGEGEIVTVGVEQYDASGIKLNINGPGANARVGREGIIVRGGGAAQLELEVRNGRYPMTRGTMHRVLVEKGTARRRGKENTVMPNPDTGALLIRDSFGIVRLTITPG